jgi:hypothetical protein
VVAIRQLLRFDVLLVGVLVIATRLGCILHEVGGHALVAQLLGAKILSIEVTLFGGGSVDYDFPTEPSMAASFWVTAAGMLVNLVTGTAALLLARRYESRHVLGPLLAVFGATSVLLPLAYLAIGGYYEAGDSGQLLYYIAEWGLPANRLLWSLGFLGLTPLLSYLALRPFCRIQQARFPSATHHGRFAIGLLTFGVAIVMYLGLYARCRHLAPQHLVAFDGGQRAQQLPNGSEMHIPMIPAVACGYLLGGAFAQRSGTSGTTATPLSWRAALGTCVVAFAMLAAIYAIGQRFI